MPVKRRVTKRREALCEDAERWLRGIALGAPPPEKNIGCIS